MKRKTKRFLVTLALDEISKRVKWSQYMAYRKLTKAESALTVEQLRSRKRLHLICGELPVEYKAIEVEIVSSRRNKDGTITQRLRPTQAVEVFKSVEEKAS